MFKHSKVEKPSFCHITFICVWCDGWRWELNTRNLRTAWSHTLHHHTGPIEDRQAVLLQIPANQHFLSGKHRCHDLVWLTGKEIHKLWLCIYTNVFKIQSRDGSPLSVFTFWEVSSVVKMGLCWLFHILSCHQKDYKWWIQIQAFFITLTEPTCGYHLQPWLRLQHHSLTNQAEDHMQH